MIKESIYKKGTSSFKKLIDYYSKNKNIIFVENKKFHVVTAYYKDAMYKHFLYNIPINLSPVNTYVNYMKERLSIESHYEELKGNLDKIENDNKLVYGLHGIIYKINKRLYNLANNDEYRNASLLQAKNKTIFTL